MIGWWGPAGRVGEKSEEESLGVSRRTSDSVVKRMGRSGR